MPKKLFKPRTGKVNKLIFLNDEAEYFCEVKTDEHELLCNVQKGLLAKNEINKMDLSVWKEINNVEAIEIMFDIFSDFAMIQKQLEDFVNGK